MQQLRIVFLDEAIECVREIGQTFVRAQIVVREVRDSEIHATAIV
jgi:hypothetical protein